jgi:hypothetical protein
MLAVIFDIDNVHVGTLAGGKVALKRRLIALVTSWLDGRLDHKPDPSKVIFQEQRLELMAGYAADDYNDFAPPIYYAKLTLGGPDAQDYRDRVHRR